MNNEALKVIASYMKNPVIMDFVTTEALEKTAKDIREKCKGGATAKAVELMMITNPAVKKRVDTYISIGLQACYIESLQLKAA